MLYSLIKIASWKEGLIVDTLSPVVKPQACRSGRRFRSGPLLRMKWLHNDSTYVWTLYANIIHLTAIWMIRSLLAFSTRIRRPPSGQRSTPRRRSWLHDRQNLLVITKYIQEASKRCTTFVNLSHATLNYRVCRWRVDTATLTLRTSLVFRKPTCVAIYWRWCGPSARTVAIHKSSCASCEFASVTWLSGQELLIERPVYSLQSHSYSQKWLLVWPLSSLLWSW